MALIEVKDLKKSFGSLEVLKRITFEIEKNDVVAVIGPSGSGKSTMLRSLIHLEQINGHEWAARSNRPNAIFNEGEVVTVRAMRDGKAYVDYKRR